MLNVEDYITTKDKRCIFIGSVKDIDLISSHYDFPHWGWFIFWLIMFPPVLIIWVLIGLFRNKYSVNIRRHNKSSIVAMISKKELDRLIEGISGDEY